jgi:hypothetical protein
MVVELNRQNCEDESTVQTTNNTRVSDVLVALREIGRAGILITDLGTAYDEWKWVFLGLSTLSQGSDKRSTTKQYKQHGLWELPTNDTS